ncbi:MAG: O-antigen ligase family protein [Nitrospinae bacterium]|nr:O-antigen ligase family protein [Nitrospinota bacterium]
MKKKKTLSLAFLVGFLLITGLFSIPSKYTDAIKNKTFIGRLSDSKDIFTPILTELNDWADEKSKELPILKEVIPDTPKHGGSIYHRYYMWRVAGEMILAHPILGVGFGTYGNNYPDYGAKVREKDSSFPLLTNGHITEFMPHAHNEVLNVFAETGIFGLVSFLMFFYFFYQLVINKLRKNPEENLIITGIFGAIITLLVYSMFSYPLRVLTSAFVFWALAGLLLSLVQMEKK